MLNKLILVLYAIFQTGTCSNCSIELIVITPNQQTNTPSASWERRLEILPGAEVAVKNINERKDVLSGCDLTIQTISSGQYKCDRENFLYLENVLGFYSHPNLAGLVKQFCSNTVGVAVGPIQKGAIASILPQYTYDDDLVDALLTLLEQMGWKDIGIVTELSETFFLHMAEALYKRLRGHSNITATLFTQLNDHESFNIGQQPKVLLVSVSAPKAIELLCQGYENDQQWPKHVWILHSYWLDDFLWYSKESSCNLHKAMEGVLLVKYKLKAGDSVSQFSEHSYTEYMHEYESKLVHIAEQNDIPLRPNPFADLLHDAIWIAALALNNSIDWITGEMAQTSFYTRIPFVSAQRQTRVLNISHFTPPVIDIIQIKHFREILVGRYTVQLRKVMFTNITFIKEAPSDLLPIHVTGGSTAYTVGLSFEIMISTLIVTCFLFLYVVFRNEPEIKSTSLSLSLFMFFGCYLTLVYLILLLISDQPNDTIDLSFYEKLCSLLQWTSGLGIPLPMIVATLLIKLIRIYYIFNKFTNTGPAPVGKQWSDMFLALLVLVTISPNILILIIWTVSDTYTVKLHYSMQNQQYIEVDKQCDSEHLLIWIACWIVYLMFLLLALVVVAFKTRNVRLRHYKDTKKVNAFIFLLNLNIFFTVSYWALLRFITTKRHISSIISHVGHSVLVILCQALLFAPKVFPPLWRRLSKKNNS